ncbi:hypothetical protein [Streptomyces monashensis]|nr:hypothetical protein [Streptomyces monashensis]
MCANDMRAAAVLAVPFLIRIAADTRHPYRANALAEVSSPARARYFGVASRAELLLHRANPQYNDHYADYGVEVTGYPAGWSVAAARAAITGDATLLKPLLHDPDPAIRIRAAYALAAATDLDRAVRASFRTRLDAEQDPIVHAALVRALAGPNTSVRGPAGRRHADHGRESVVLTICHVIGRGCYKWGIGSHPASRGLFTSNNLSRPAAGDGVLEGRSQIRVVCSVRQ